MMIGLFGYMTGYDGRFPFESPGQKYNETKYLGMRLVLSFSTRSLHFPLFVVNCACPSDSSVVPLLGLSLFQPPT